MVPGLMQARKGMIGRENNGNQANYTSISYQPGSRFALPSLLQGLARSTTPSPSGGNPTGSLGDQG